MIPEKKPLILLWLVSETAIDVTGARYVPAVQVNGGNTANDFLFFDQRQPSCSTLPDPGPFFLS